MINVYMACDNVVRDAEEMTLESTALLLNPKQYSPINASLTYMGLESTTSLNRYISQEGLFSWVKEKLSRIGRSITVAVNKIYAKLTKADQATKDLIERASKDDSISLPISGKRVAALAGIAAAAATVITVTCVAVFSGKSEDKEKSKSLFAKFKGMFKKDNSEDKPEKVKSGIVKSSLEKIRKAISTIIKTIKEFFSRFKKSASATESEARAQDNTENKGILGRLRGIGGAIKRMFSTVVGFIKNVVNKLRRDTKSKNRKTNFDNFTNSTGHNSGTDNEESNAPELLKAQEMRDEAKASFRKSFDDLQDIYPQYKHAHIYKLKGILGCRNLGERGIDNEFLHLKEEWKGNYDQLDAEELRTYKANLDAVIKRFIGIARTNMRKEAQAIKDLDDSNKSFIEYVETTGIKRLGGEFPGIDSETIREYEQKLLSKSSQVVKRMRTLNESGDPKQMHKVEDHFEDFRQFYNDLKNDLKEKSAN